MLCYYAIMDNDLLLENKARIEDIRFHYYDNAQKVMNFINIYDGNNLALNINENEPYNYRYGLMVEMAKVTILNPMNMETKTLTEIQFHSPRAFIDIYQQEAKYQWNAIIPIHAISASIVDNFLIIKGIGGMSYRMFAGDKRI